MKAVLKVIQPEDVIDNSWTVEKIVNIHPSPTWEKVFADSKHELKDISDILESDKKVNGRYYPDNINLFRALDLTPLPRVKVVIFGQDPYHNSNPDGTPQAQGLSFSVKKGTKIPSSLQNIYKELKNSIDGFKIPSHGCLEYWCRQGVLMLNGCLTVRPGNPGCHKELWLGFIKKIVNAILDENPGCVFILWGRQAQKIRKMLGERATVLEAAHPSGFSANKGFFGCNHLVEVNRLLREKGQKEIDWQIS